MVYMYQVISIVNKDFLIWIQSVHKFAICGMIYETCSTLKKFMFSGIADAILSRRQLLLSGCPSGVFASLENSTKAI